MNMKYTFGTDDRAASRLKDMAKFFNPLASQLVQQYAPMTAMVALDLGCGPGFTTDMLFHAARAEVTCGLDTSAQFIATAREQFPHCRFLEHDITRVPFPMRADVMYVRFVLSHLPRPVERVNTWVTQLTPGGILVIEEVEAVDTPVEVFNLYLSTNAAVVASQGANLFVGPLLAGGEYKADLLLDDCALLPVPDSQAASWFLPNTETFWRQSECVLERFSLPEIESISRSLKRLVASGGQSSRITWRIRRIVLRQHSEAIR